MSTCQNCGAAIELARNESVRCKFCDAPNAPLPLEVAVPVPVQVVNQVVQLVGGAETKDALELRCPHCRRRLATVRAAGVDLNGCGACGGIWIDNAGASKVVTSPEAIFSELADRAARRNAARTSKSSNEPICASCPAKLDRAQAHGLTLDICTEHGTWFDAWELKRLIEALRSPTKTSPPAGGSVACAGCGTSLPSADMNVSGAGLKCDACWRREQDGLSAAPSDAGALGTIRFLEGDASGRQFSVPAQERSNGAQLVVGALGVLVGAAASTSSRR